MDEDEAEPRGRFIDWPSLAMALLPLIAIAFDAWGVLYYRQGLRNEMIDFTPSALGVGIVISFAIAGLLVRGYMLIKRRDSRTMFVGLLMLLVLMIWPAMCAMRPMPIEIYRLGLTEWARANVDAKAIREWGLAMRPVTSPTLVRGGGGQPLAVSRIEPSVIEQHPNGIVMQWGTLAAMPGRQRKVFIGIDDATQPPDEGRRFWTQVQPGVYVGVHGPPP